MGKNYNNYMSKKGFHPASAANQRKIEEAEAQAQAKLKKDQELAEKYRKEQELFKQRAMISKESKEKLSLSFMYDVPKELKNNNKNQDLQKADEKVEWTNSRIASTSSTDESQMIEGKKTEICLEWKRDKPRKKIKLEETKTTLIKKEPSIKTH